VRKSYYLKSAASCARLRTSLPGRQPRQGNPALRGAPHGERGWGPSEDIRGACCPLDPNGRGETPRGSHPPEIIHTTATTGDEEGSDRAESEIPGSSKASSRPSAADRRARWPSSFGIKSSSVFVLPRSLEAGASRVYRRLAPRSPSQGVPSATSAMKSPGPIRGGRAGAPPRRRGHQYDAVKQAYLLEAARSAGRAWKVSTAARDQGGILDLSTIMRLCRPRCCHAAVDATSCPQRLARPIASASITEEAWPRALAAIKILLSNQARAHGDPGHGGVAR
jgi:hypothetical protein